MKIEDSELSFSGPLPFEQGDVARQVCTEGLEQRSMTLSVLPEFFGELVQKALPDCSNLEMTDSGWSCTLTRLTDAERSQRFVLANLALFRKWKRQPYLFSRRLAVSQSLSDLLSMEDYEARIPGFCRILSEAIPVELPLAFRDMRWQKNLCSGSVAFSKTVARLGLTKALEEQSFMQTLIDRVASRGFLSFRLPQAELPTKEVWIKLYPGRKVRSSIKAAIKELWVHRWPSLREVRRGRTLAGILCLEAQISSFKFRNTWSPWAL